MPLRIIGTTPQDVIDLQAKVTQALADAAAAKAAAASAQAAGDNARQMVLNRDPRLDTLSTEQTTLADKQVTLEQLAATLGAAIPASEQVHTALAARIAALEALKVIVGFGTVTLTGSLLAGATQTINVPLSRNMGSATYSTGYAITGGSSILGSLQIVGVTTQTTAVVSLQVKNAGLTALANLTTASISVVAARDA